jgi:hypothetical protein
MLPQQSLHSPQYAAVVIDDKNEVSIGQERHPLPAPGFACDRTFSLIHAFRGRSRRFHFGLALRPDGGQAAVDAAINFI